MTEWLEDTLTIYVVIGCIGLGILVLYTLMEVYSFNISLMILL